MADIVIVGYKTELYDEENLPIPDFDFSKTNWKEATKEEKRREKTEKFIKEANGLPFLSYISDLFAVAFPSGETTRICCDPPDVDPDDAGTAGYDFYDWLFNKLGYSWPKNYNGHNHPFVIYGFDPKVLIKLAGHETARKGSFDDSFPPELWVGNGHTYKDIRNCLISPDYEGIDLKTAFDWYGIPNPSDDWEPGNDVREDVILAIEIAAHLQLLNYDAADLGITTANSSEE